MTGFGFVGDDAFEEDALDFSGLDCLESLSCFPLPCNRLRRLPLLSSFGLEVKEGDLW